VSVPQSKNKSGEIEIVAILAWLLSFARCFLGLASKWPPMSQFSLFSFKTCSFWLN